MSFPLTIIGWQITRDTKGGTLTIDQQACIHDLLDDLVQRRQPTDEGRIIPRD